MKNKPPLGLRTAIYKVGNLDAAKTWYSEAFGAKPYFDQPFYVGFNIGGYELGLDPDSEAVTQKADSVLAYWGVDDVHATYRHFIGSGATAHEAPHEVGEGIVVATVKDPWGNVIGFIYNPHFTGAK